MSPLLPADAHIAHAHFIVRDLARALAFYRDAMGFHVIDEDETSARLSANGTAPHHIELTALPNAIAQPQRSTGLYHVAIRLPNRAALARVFYRLAALNWEFQGFSDHQVSEAIYLADVDGNGLELYRDRPRDEWRMDGDQVQMGSERLDAEKLLMEGAHAFEAWQGIDPATDIGHVHLHVSNLAAAEAFYCTALGMSVMQRGYPGALFVAAGGYHHHVGLNTWAGEGAPPPPAHAVGLRSFGVRIPDQAAWQAAIERLQAAGYAVEIHDTHASVRSNDGLLVELVR
jgi:catechol 2,3-dioxygenase